VQWLQEELKGAEEQLRIQAENLQQQQQTETQQN
jgi:hypothetical protein